MIYTVLEVSKATLFRWRKSYSIFEIEGLENYSRRPNNVRKPIKIYSIQVDGGSEFMADFEELCKQKRIKLYVLPPRSPKLNAFIERSNNTAHYEFYALHLKSKDIDDLKANLCGFVAFYNEIRPHQHLKYLTPMRYFSYWKERNINQTFSLICIERGEAFDTLSIP